MKKLKNKDRFNAYFAITANTNRTCKFYKLIRIYTTLNKFIFKKHLEALFQNNYKTKLHSYL